MAEVEVEPAESVLAATRMYGRHGFVQVPRFGPYLDSETSICMAWQLAADATDIRD